MLGFVLDGQYLPSLSLRELLSLSLPSVKVFWRKVLGDAMDKTQIRAIFIAAISALLLSGCSVDFAQAVKTSLDGYANGYDAYLRPRSDHGAGWAYFADTTISEELCPTTLPTSVLPSVGKVYFPTLDIAGGLDAAASVKLAQGFITNAPAASAWLGANGISEVKLTLTNVQQYLLPAGYNYSPYKVSSDCRKQISDYMKHHPGQPVYIIVAAFAADGIDFTFTQGSGTGKSGASAAGEAGAGTPGAGGAGKATVGSSQGTSPSSSSQQCSGNAGYDSVGAGASIDFSKVGQLDANLCYAYKTDNVLSVRAANGDKLWIAYHTDPVTDISQIQ
jgi:hypothetical protein